MIKMISHIFYQGNPKVIVIDRHKPDYLNFADEIIVDTIKRKKEKKNTKTHKC